MSTNNLYTIDQLQAADFLLKRAYVEHETSVQLVIEHNNSLWYGDFVRLKGANFQQPLLEYDGIDNQNSYHLSSITLALDLFLKYVDYKERPFFQDPLEGPIDLPAIYIFLTDLLKDIDSIQSNNPLSPFIYNARTIDGNTKLPFLNLENEKLKLVSVIAVNE